MLTWQFSITRLSQLPQNSSQFRAVAARGSQVRMSLPSHNLRFPAISYSAFLSDLWPPRLLIPRFSVSSLSFGYLPSVYGHRNKALQVSWFKTTEMHCLMILEAGTPRSTCGRGHADTPEAPGRVCPRPPGFRRRLGSWRRMSSLHVAFSLLAHWSLHPNFSFSEGYQSYWIRVLPYSSVTSSYPN